MRTIKFFKYFLLLSVLLGITSSCNSNKKDEESLTSDSVRISAFSLKADSTLIDNLDKVFFTIDLEKGLIYNADSLPMGTNVSALVVNITTESASEVSITSAGETFNYLNEKDKKIDFNDPVIAKVVSFSGLKEMEYEIKVNVHNTQPDYFAWGDMQFSKLPGENKPTESRTVKFNETIYCFSTLNDTHSVATAAHPGDSWDIIELNLSFTPQWSTLKAATDNIYILDTDGNMYSSSNGIDWNTTGAKYANILGCLNNQVLTLTLDGEQYYHDIYPRPEGFTPYPAAKEFPVTGFSDMLTYDSAWLTSPQGMILGGRTASGQLTGAMWGYDGNSWAMLNDQITPREGAMFFSYVTFFIDDNWITTEMPAWYVIGGINDTETLGDSWVSNNYGITWTRANHEMIFPDYIAARGYASIIINEEPVGTSLSGWTTLPSTHEYRSLPLYSSADAQLVPYVYMFGGKTRIGSGFNEVWRGVINRLTFEPIP